MQVSSLDFSMSPISNMLYQLRNEIQYLNRSGAFIPEYAIDPAKLTPQWSTLLINIGNQLRQIQNPALADTTVYNIIEGGAIPEGIGILIKNDVFIISDVYYNLYNLLANFVNTYGQMLQNLALQAQYTNYGKKYKKKCKGKCKGKTKCNCR